MQIYKNETPSIKEAARLATEWLYEEFETRVANAIKSNNDFIYEGHFPDEENWSTPRRFESAGYKINFIFLGLSHPATSEQRVFLRAKKGGHNVPYYEIERNFYGNLRQLNKHFNLIDELQIIDTSGSRRSKFIAAFLNGKVTEAVPVRQIPEWFEAGLPNLFQLIFLSQNPLDFKYPEKIIYRSIEFTHYTSATQRCPIAPLPPGSKKSL